jgi:hypothetical protein
MKEIFEYIILIFIRSGKISKIVISRPDDIFGLGEGNFHKNRLLCVKFFRRYDLKLSSLDSGSYFIFESSRRQMIVFYGGGHKKHFYAEIINSYDKNV